MASPDNILGEWGLLPHSPKTLSFPRPNKPLKKSPKKSNNNTQNKPFLRRKSQTQPPAGRPAPDAGVDTLKILKECFSLATGSQKTCRMEAERTGSNPNTLSPMSSEQSVTYVPERTKHVGISAADR